MNRPFHGGIILLLLLAESFGINFLIRHLHISHNAPYLLPKICITFVFHFFWVLQPSQEKVKTMLMQNFGGQIRCIYGRCASGEWKFRLFYLNLTGVSKFKCKRKRRLILVLGVKRPHRANGLPVMLGRPPLLKWNRLCVCLTFLLETREYSSKIREETRNMHWNETDYAFA